MYSQRTQTGMDMVTQIAIANYAAAMYGSRSVVTNNGIEVSNNRFTLDDALNIALQNNPGTEIDREALSKFREINEHNIRDNTHELRNLILKNSRDILLPIIMLYQ